MTLVIHSLHNHYNSSNYFEIIDVDNGTEVDDFYSYFEAVSKLVAMKLSKATGDTTNKNVIFECKDGSTLHIDARLFALKSILSDVSELSKLITNNVQLLDITSIIKSSSMPYHDKETLSLIICILLSIHKPLLTGCKHADIVKVYKEASVNIEYCNNRKTFLPSLFLSSKVCDLDFYLLTEVK